MRSSIFAPLSAALFTTLLSSIAASQAPQPNPNAPRRARTSPPTGVRTRTGTSAAARAWLPGHASTRIRARSTGAGSTGTRPRTRGPRRRPGPVSRIPTLLPRPVRRRRPRARARPAARSGFSGSFDGSQAAAGAAAAAPAEEDQQAERARSLQEQNSIYGATGLLRTVGAGSGAAGHVPRPLAAQLVYRDSFLCRDGAPCRSAVSGRDHATRTTVTQFGTNVGLVRHPGRFPGGVRVDSFVVDLERQGAADACSRCLATRPSASRRSRRTSSVRRSTSAGRQICCS